MSERTTQRTDSTHVLAAVKEQLVRYGAPVYRRFLDHGPIVRGMSHSTRPPAVVDPESAPSAPARMMNAASDLARRLRPELLAGTRATPPVEVATASVTPAR